MDQVIEMFKLLFNGERIAINDSVNKYVDTYALCRGQTVGLQSARNDRIVIHYIACLQVGALPVFIPSYFTEEMMRYIQGLLKMDTLIKESAIVGHCNNGCSFSCNNAFDPGSLIHTTTATGHQPKLIYRSRYSLEKETERFQQVLGINTNDVIYPAVPLFHSFGLICGFLTSLRYNCTLSLSSGMHIANIRSVLNRTQPSIIQSSPGVFNVLSRHSKSIVSLQCARCILSTGAPLPEDTRTAFILAYNKYIVSQYGTSETGCIALNRQQDNASEFGLIYPGIDVHISPHKEIIIDTHGAAGAYVVNNSSVSVEQDHLYATGDIGSFEHGRLYICGRKERHINNNGQKLSLSFVSTVVEKEIGSHDLHVEVNNDGSIHYIIYANKIVDCDQLRTHIKQQLPSFVWPSKITIKDKIHTWK